MFKFKFITILFIVLSLACNISVLQAKLVERSSKKMPNWIGKNFEDKKKLYFSGSSTQSAFDKARQAAINDALTQVTQSLDLTMSVNTNRLISDTGIFLDERTKTKTREVRLLDTKIKDVYYEKYEEKGKYLYTVHALVEYNKKDYEEEKARLAKEYAQLKQNVANRYTKAKQLINTNNMLQALPELFEALKIIYIYGVNQTLEQEIAAVINDILDDISFKNSFNISDNHSGVKAEISAYFDKTNEVCSKYVFNLKSLNGFSIETISANDEGIIDYSF
ncbi:MAG: LPP20 family lipoprotein, partial [Endomicrobiaceae bacterium]|nr:LPP20 family lipoprotein [Endomicrobiaceae bacterium]